MAVESKTVNTTKMQQRPLITAWTTGGELPPKRKPPRSMQWSFEERDKFMRAMFSGFVDTPSVPPEPPQKPEQERLDI